MQKIMASIDLRQCSAETNVRTMHRRRVSEASTRVSWTIALICSIGPTRNIIL